jgi:hypothetical protein
MKKEIIYNSKYLSKVLFWLLPLIYTFLYGQYGYDFVDAGLITSGSWRILLGEVPYRDFFWGKPPFSLYLHSLQLLLIPDQFQVIAERFLYYAQVVIYSHLFSAIIKRYFSNELKGVDVYLLSMATFIYSAHNWPPFSWYTIDGIFFSTLGFYFLLNWNKLSFSIIGIFFGFLAALTKQSFYLIPIMMLFVSYFIYDKKRTLQLFLALIIFSTLSLIIVYNVGIYEVMLQNITGQTELKELINYGFYRYLNRPAIYLFIGIIVYLFARFKYFKIKDEMSLVFLAVCLAFAVLTVKLGFDNVRLGRPSIWVDDDLGFFISLFMVATLFVFYSLITQYKNKWLVLGAMLFISWSAALSWGYNLPANFSGPLIFGSVLFVSQITLKDHVIFSKSIRNVLIVFSVIGLVQFYVLNQFVWKDSPRSELTYDLGIISNKLKFIKTDKGGYEKIDELFKLHKKYGDNYSVIPTFPGAHYLTGAINPLPTDTEFNSEHLYQVSLLINPIKQKDITIFIEKDETSGYIPHLLKNKLLGYKYGSDITFWVMDNMIKIDSMKHFDVYKGLK